MGGSHTAAFKRQMFLKDVPLFKKLTELERFAITAACTVRVVAQFELSISSL